ncbi:MAG: Class I SAM-dependent methyltransferase [uncultured Campylobacterales bacterium]|uniref:Class I SAM-dependent methyltransferase n=1 Tax=uncultured Campylobacterales bacterium TaxID=352960 RepID=A0A6S6SSJ2_9BACT|nr:MAG: Class I SAM-dependent methyltransferase [uncultured Campylobacterales bacterium]
MKNLGAFNTHFCASVPYSLEERIRLSYTIAKYSSEKQISYYETSSAEGTDARSIAEYGNAKTLTNSINKANQRTFNKLLNHNNSKFYLGSFVDITPKFIKSNYKEFENGFDIIHENTTFQFYDGNRDLQIDYLSQVLKSDGIMIFTEKMLQKDMNEYKKREDIKNKLHKLKYFSQDEIEWKDEKIMQAILKYEVRVGSLINSIKRKFKYVYMIWNSSNFYRFVASNNKDNIERFISLLPKAYVPEEFCYEENLPKRF